MYKFKNIKVLLLIILLNLLSLFLLNNIIYSEDILYNIFKNEIEIKRIDILITLFNQYNVFLLILFPIIFLVKVYFITIIIFIGIKFFEIKISFDNTFKIVIFAYFIPLISSIVKNIYFYLYPPSNIELVESFNPLGLTFLLKINSIPKYLLYPLQQLNLYEVGYWLLLSYGINTLGNIEFKKALKVTTLSYGVGLAIWCVFVVFIQLQFS
jgi:hypothetical protein